MKLLVDTHTHTYASGHAYSTLIENAKAAKERGLAMFCTTDHSESMPGAPHYWFFSNQRILPRFIEGVAVIRGVESNIMNTKGEIDIPPSVDNNIDWVLASFHEAVFTPIGKAAHTEALINVILSGRVDALGHLGNPSYDFDFNAVIQCAVENNVAIEINNTSLKGNSRAGSVERCTDIAVIAQKKGAFITTGSDAHFCMDVGDLNLAANLIERVGIAEEKVITHSPEQFLHFLTLRGKKIIDDYSMYY
ncbi:phosphatase [Vibrio sp. S9_S30]|uniref:phosphatase n=1 Tax=Vibrio sp. S9_S30 TaxID=2720226 RepID=UPI00167FF3CC|nr:phosphatase [Vibrio sp. S9_S30]MBD1558726.1 phosphatase [Vibrio sp. S9_S30]